MQKQENQKLFRESLKKLVPYHRFVFLLFSFKFLLSFNCSRKAKKVKEWHLYLLRRRCLVRAAAGLSSAASASRSFNGPRILSPSSIKSSAADALDLSAVCAAAAPRFLGAAGRHILAARDCIEPGVGERSTSALSPTRGPAADGATTAQPRSHDVSRGGEGGLREAASLEERREGARCGFSVGIWRQLFFCCPI